MKVLRAPRWWKGGNFKLSFAGIHIIADFWFSRHLEQKEELKRLLLAAAKAAGATPLKISLHKFSPQGLAGILLIAESHLALHTWPEIEYIALDIFTCGKNMKPRRALAFLRKELRPKKVSVREFVRGRVPSR